MKHVKVPLVILGPEVPEFEEGFISQVGIRVLEGHVHTKP